MELLGREVHAFVVSHPPTSPTAHALHPAHRHVGPPARGATLAVSVCRASSLDAKLPSLLSCRVSKNGDAVREADTIRRFTSVVNGLCSNASRPSSILLLVQTSYFFVSFACIIRLPVTWPRSNFL